MAGMGSPHDTQSEQDRIRAVYRNWLGKERLAAYAWHRPDIMEQDAARRRIGGAMLAEAFGPELGNLDVVDVGCGTGGFLRQLVDWGADPARLLGTEYQPERLARARQRSAPGIGWHLGDLDILGNASVDLAVANTVFSSILDPVARLSLAAAMWRVLRPGGWTMLFDLRYNNPANGQVRRLDWYEVRALWPTPVYRYRTLLLAPPLARRLARAPRLAGELLAAIAPPLRSHFIYMARKPL